ncbi:MULTISPECIES: tyrosinase family protein [unclassified Streptomyces]|uniref:tyrosinase family protein n=1 Tax=unclassified Streptomyces TaxID=2593676 RepID=UPI0011A308F5|nr:tyrosinase family protein [Streptomyces sp. BK340]TVZ94279.1 common central domain of tyrosinase [Streptomyces sp. BK340]
MSPRKAAKTAAERFPTAEDALEIASEWAPAQLIDSEEIGLRLNRMMADGHVQPGMAPPGPAVAAFAAQLAAAGLGDAAWHMPAGTAAPMPAPVEADQLRSLVTRLVRASQRVRKDHRQLSDAERDRYNEVLRGLATTPAYKQLVADHQDMSHRHHTMQGMGPVATQRFLPWHRAYCLKFEDLLRSADPALTIPYWDYANDHARPDWVWKPAGVVRPTPAGSGLPTQATIDGLLARPTFTAFTFGRVMAGVQPNGLEVAAHNNVHNWCGGTLSKPMASSNDPIFFLLHANVDRIWDQWQLTHTGGPNVTGADAGLDPWWTQAAGGLTTDSVKDITVLGYSYQ